MYFTDAESVQTNDEPLAESWRCASNATVPSSAAHLACGFQIPQFGAEFIEWHGQQRERLTSFDDVARRKAGGWLLFAIENGLTSARSVARAWNSRRLYTATTSLIGRSLNRLKALLNQRVSEHAPREIDAVYLSLDEETCSLCVRWMLANVQSIQTLALLPSRLASTIYQTITLIDSGLLPCVLPHNLLSGGFSFYIDEGVGDYDKLLKAGVADDPDKAAAYIDDHPDDFEYILSMGDIGHSLGILKEAHVGPPAWMRGGHKTPPQVLARRLARQLRDWISIDPALSNHPWVQYAARVLNVIRTEFPDTSAWEKSKKAWRRLSIDESFDGETYLGHANMLTSNTALEGFEIDSLYEDLGNAGEYPSCHFIIEEVASKELCLILERMALGIGLLRRAGIVNSQVEKMESKA